MDYNGSYSNIKLLHVFVILAVLLFLFYNIFTHESIRERHIGNFDKVIRSLPTMKYIITAANTTKNPDYNIWLTFTKVTVDSPLKYKFRNLINNVLNATSVPLKFHVIIDEVSMKIAVAEFRRISSKKFSYFFYNIKDVATDMQDIVSAMTPHFSSKPGTYYSDALFYMSLGLYRFAPSNQDLAIFLDCDLYFKDDIILLFREFARFKPTALFGLAPELSPVYRHVLYRYRLNHKTTLGEFYHSNNISTQPHPRGFQGYNSGVVLLNLQKIRQSKVFPKLLTHKSVDALSEKYNFQGHLGDQDFYTLLGCEYPDLIQTLNCGFNKQMCTWWRDNGYKDIFDKYFKCDHKVVVLHGNCNTDIPK